MVNFNRLIIFRDIKMVDILIFYCIYYLKCVIFRAHVPYFLKIISGLGSGDWMLGGVVRSRIVLGLKTPEPGTEF